VVVRSKNSPPVLNGVSLSLDRGEKVAILGPSGAGKTTLFRAINGFVPIHSGSIRVDDISVKGQHGKHLRQLRRRIAVVSQRHDLVDRLRVHQNVMAGALGRWSAWRALRFLFWPKAEELAEAEHALRRVGLAGKLRTPTSELSGGEHQRVAIARALVQQPSLLLADEPIASLDPELSEQILTLLCDLASETGFALFCSLHQQEYAYKYFDRVIRIQHGAVETENGSRLAATQSGAAD
ncbi:MAG TPA: ATP-binding cassette domain-containing protein, partial [Candidatus Angelobacter sp.]|nr:ATP-binding cassette domain-containing protein [Candidatus Angelobacter sp.]